MMLRLRHVAPRFTAAFAGLILSACAADVDLEAQNALDTLADREQRITSDIGATPFGEQVRRAVEEHPAVLGAISRVEAAQAQIAAAEAGSRVQISVGLDSSAALVGGANDSIQITPIVTVSQYSFSRQTSPKRS